MSNWRHKDYNSGVAPQKGGCHIKKIEIHQIETPIDILADKLMMKFCYMLAELHIIRGIRLTKERAVMQINAYNVAHNDTLKERPVN